MNKFKLNKFNKFLTKIILVYYMKSSALRFLLKLIIGPSPNLIIKLTNGWITSLLENEATVVAGSTKIIRQKFM